MVPSVLASSVCWSLQCLISALTQGGRWWALFLGSLVQSRCGEGGMLQTNNTGVCSHCLSHTGPALAHGACALPAHTAQALGCSAGNCLRLALGYMHFPGLAAQVQVLGYFSQAQTVGPVFRPSQVRAAQVTRCLASAIAVTYHLPHPCRLVFWVYNRRTFSGLLCVSSGGLISGCDPHGGCPQSRIPRSLG